MTFTHDQLNALQFSLDYPGWHTFANDETTFRVIWSLQKNGYIDTNEFNQFRANSRTKALNLRTAATH